MIRGVGEKEKGDRRKGERERGRLLNCLTA